MRGPVAERAPPANGDTRADGVVPHRSIPLGEPPPDPDGERGDARGDSAPPGAPPSLTRG